MRRTFLSQRLLMTKKLAVFVEGLTEQEFTIRLLSELAGNQIIKFEILRQNKGHLSFVEFRTNLSQEPAIHVLVANCCHDKQVKSQINYHYKKLITDGYDLIIGLRDVHPFKPSDIPKLEENLLKGLTKGNIPIHMHLAIMEIEAWFLEEISHFPSIDKKITITEIIANGFDFKKIRAHDLQQPSVTLDNIYKAVGKRYNKTRKNIQRTVKVLSYEELYINTRLKALSLDKFINSLKMGIFPKKE